jgi:hypothetical protein
MDYQSRPPGNFLDNTVKMPFGSYHRPEMLDGINAFETCQSGLGNRFERFTGRIADKMQMQPITVRHQHGATTVTAQAGENLAGAKLGINIGRPG